MLACLALCLVAAFPRRSTAVEELCAERQPVAARDACLRDAVHSHRLALEAASSRCTLADGSTTDDECVRSALRPTLTAAGVLRPGQLERAAAIFAELPRFHDQTGAPLNAAAARLVAGPRAHGRGGDAGADGLTVRASWPLTPRSSASAHAGEVARVRIAEGLWKYVLLQVEDASGGKALLVRNEAGKAYHAEMAEGARRELAALGLQALHVLGGGRIRHDAAGKAIAVYGYSKTYGHCESCNRVAAELIRAAPEYRRCAVTWSNEGY